MAAAWSGGIGVLTDGLAGGAEVTGGAGVPPVGTGAPSAGATVGTGSKIAPGGVEVLPSVTAAAGAGEAPVVVCPTHAPTPSAATTVTVATTAMAPRRGLGATEWTGAPVPVPIVNPSARALGGAAPSEVIATATPDAGIDLYVGSGGAPEGVLAAAALRCIGGQMQGRLLFRNDDERARAARWGVTDLNRKYGLEDLAKGDVMFAATGVTNGSMLKGVRRFPGGAQTHSVVMRSKSGTVRYVDATHNFRRKVVPKSQAGGV